MSIEVVIPASNRRLTTLDAARAEVGLLFGDTSEDVLLERLIDQASSAAETFCQRVFAEEEVVETLYLPRHSWTIFVSRYPVTKVHDDSVIPLFDVGPGDLKPHRGAGEIKRREPGQYRMAAFAPGDMAIHYTAGWKLPGDPERNLPHDIERAVLLAVSSYYRGRQRDPLVKSERIAVEGIEDIQTSYGLMATSLPAEAQALLAPYRTVSL